MEVIIALMNGLALSAALLIFQAGAVPQQTRPEDRGSISGYILKIGAGEPISKAVVTISAVASGRNQSYTATTTAGGQFAFQNLPPGQYRLTATRNGYVRMEYGARSPNRPGLPITLSPGQKLTNVALQLVAAGTITGRVFDRDGEPQANVNVEALKYSYQEGQRVLNVVQTARTNDLGEYRLFWLQPGQYFVSATPPAGQRGALLNALAVAGPGIGGAIADIIANRGGRGGNAGRGAVGGQRGAVPQPAPVPAPAPPTNSPEQTDEGYVPVYYPGTTDSQSAAPIHLPAGTVFSGVDLTIAAVQTVRVQGQVINGVTGQPALNATVTLLPVQRTAGNGVRAALRNAVNLRSRVDNQGGFEIRGVAPGSYEVMAIVNERNNRMTARMPLEIGGADVRSVSLIVSSGFTLTGRLAIEGQAGAGTPEQSRPRVTLRPESAGQIGGGAPAAAVQADGTFTLQQVGRDDYRVTVAGMPRNTYIKMARFAGIDVMSEGIRLDRQPGGQLEILLSTNTGIADGMVQNEKQQPAVNVMVTFVPESTRRNRLDLYRTISTDAAGRFRIDGVPPGDYRVFAWEDIETGAWQDPDFIRAFEDRGRPVRITEGGTSNLELRVIPAQM
jgi:hypothetical protein